MMLDERTIDLLAALAEEHGTSMSTIVRASVAFFAEKAGPGQRKKMIAEASPAVEAASAIAARKAAQAEADGQP